MDLQITSRTRSARWDHCFLPEAKIERSNPWQALVLRSSICCPPVRLSEDPRAQDFLPKGFTLSVVWWAAGKACKVATLRPDSGVSHLSRNEKWLACPGLRNLPGNITNSSMFTISSQQHLESPIRRGRYGRLSRMSGESAVR